MSSSTITERHEFPPKGTNSRRRRAVLVAIFLSALYLISIWFSVSEAERRSVRLEIPPEGGDYLSMDVDVVQVDMTRGEMTTRISFHLAGKLARDEVTPATDLQLVLNTVHGQQQFDFAKGKRINPIEAVFPLQGQVNFYPFDHHTGVLWLVVTIPEDSKGRSTPNIAPKRPAPRGLQKLEPENAQEELAESPGLPVGASTLMEQVQADTSTNFTASIPGLTFRGSNLVQSAQGMKGLTGIQVQLRRSRNVIFISLTSMLMMAALAVGLVTMVLKIVSGTRRATFHIPMAVSLIFGLPALRNIQPGIPPIGTFGDSVAFTWAEVAAAGSAVALVVHWLLNRTPNDTPPTEQS